MTPAQAYTIASQWGSYVRAGDPGACFYSFHGNDARPIHEAHRQACLDYTFGLIKDLRDDTPDADIDAETAADIAELRALWDYFTTAPLYCAAKATP